MKKIVAIVTGFALFAGTATAEGIGFRMWGRSVWDVASNSDNEIKTGMIQSWGDIAPRIGVGMHGNAGNIGFVMDLAVDGAKRLSIGENAHIWVTPAECVRLAAGHMNLHELRGDACFGMWNWYRLGAVRKTSQEGWTFPGIFDTDGVNIILYPTAGLTMGAAIPLAGLGQNTKAATLAETYGRAAKYGMAYSVAGIGTVKTGISTAPLKRSDDDVTLYAALDLTAMKNLYASVGAEIPTDGREIKANAYGRYRADAMTLHAIVGTKFNSADKKKDDYSGFGITFGAGADYNFENGSGIFADIRYANNIYYSATSAGEKDALTFGFGAHKGFSGGKFGIAFEGTTNGGFYNNEAFGWGIPVVFECMF